MWATCVRVYVCVCLFYRARELQALLDMVQPNGPDQPEVEDDYGSKEEETDDQNDQIKQDPDSTAAAPYANGHESVPYEDYSEPVGGVHGMSEAHGYNGAQNGSGVPQRVSSGQQGQTVSGSGSGNSRLRGAGNSGAVAAYGGSPPHGSPANAARHPGSYVVQAAHVPGGGIRAHASHQSHNMTVLAQGPHANGVVTYMPQTVHSPTQVVMNRQTVGIRQPPGSSPGGRPRAALTADPPVIDLTDSPVRSGPPPAAPLAAGDGGHGSPAWQSWPAGQSQRVSHRPPQQAPNNSAPQHETLVLDSDDDDPIQTQTQVLNPIKSESDDEDHVVYLGHSPDGPVQAKAATTPAVRKQGAAARGRGRGPPGGVGRAPMPGRGIGMGVNSPGAASRPLQAGRGAPHAAPGGRGAAVAGRGGVRPQAPAVAPPAAVQAGPSGRQRQLPVPIAAYGGRPLVGAVVGAAHVKPSLKSMIASIPLPPGENPDA